MTSRPRAITIVPPTGKVPVGGEGTTLPRFKDRVGGLIRHHAPGAQGLFCVDLSWNDCSTLGELDHWQLHVHGVVWNLSDEALPALKRALGGDKRAAHKPIRVERLYDPAGQLAYMAKPELSLRVGYVDAKGRRNTRLGRLTLAQELALMRWLSAYTVEQRFFRIGELPDVVDRKSRGASS